METSRHDIDPGPQQSGERIELMLQKQLKARLDQFKDEVAQRPFFWVAIAFLAGLVSCTFPVRLLVFALLRLLSLLLGPAILLLGMLKISELFSESKGQPANAAPL